MSAKKAPKVKADAIAGIGKRGGAARQAGKKVESRKSSNRSALDFARKMTMRQGTDSANPRPKR